MQHDAGWDVMINEYAADINKDNEVDMLDGMLILQQGTEETEPQ